MRTFRWLVAVGVLSFSGLALAEDQAINQDQPTARSSKKRVKAKPDTYVAPGSDVRTSYDQSRQDLNQAGQDVKQGMNQAGQDVKESAQSAKENVQGAAQNAGEVGAAGAQKAGAEVGQAIREGGGAVAGQKSPVPMGFLNSGKAIRNTITTDPIGMAIGYGLNAEYSHAVGSKWDLLGGARFAHNRLGDASVNNFAVDVGADYFIIGRNNEGLRIGPRLEAGLGGATGPLVTNTNGSLFGNFAAAGELGYNWVASNGITAGAAAGLRGRLAETNAGNNVNNAGVGPYAKLNLGYSW